MTLQAECARAERAASPTRSPQTLQSVTKLKGAREACRARLAAE